MPTISYNLDRGDGVCKHLNELGLCDIYDHRPDFCNVDLMYEKYFHKYYTLEEYHRINEENCKKLMAQAEQGK